MCAEDVKELGCCSVVEVCALALEVQALSLQGKVFAGGKISFQWKKNHPRWWAIPN